jgi:hypothetical protein
VSTKAPRRALGVHSSGRFDRPVESLAASVRRLRRVTRGRGLLRRRVAFITGTEAAGRSHDDLDRVLGSDPAWRYTHIGGRASGECWATWRASHLELGDREPFARRLTRMTWRRSAEYGGKEAPPVEALVVPLQVVGRPHRRRVYLVVVHMPLDNTENRAAIWVDCCRGLRILVTQIRASDPHAVIVLEADWNKNYRDPRERAMLRQHVARPLRLVQGWDGSTPARGGTHGRQLIDGVITSAAVLGWSTPWCWLTRDDRSSDHRPYVHTVRWPLLPKRIRATLATRKKENR